MSPQIHVLDFRMNPGFKGDFNSELKKFLTPLQEAMKEKEVRIPWAKKFDPFFKIKVGMMRIQKEAIDLGFSEAAVRSPGFSELHVSIIRYNAPQGKKIHDIENFNKFEPTAYLRGIPRSQFLGAASELEVLDLDFGLSLEEMRRAHFSQWHVNALNRRKTWNEIKDMSLLELQLQFPEFKKTAFENDRYLQHSEHGTIRILCGEMMR